MARRLHRSNHFAAAAVWFSATAHVVAGCALLLVVGRAGRGESAVPSPTEDPASVPIAMVEWSTSPSTIPPAADESAPPPPTVPAVAGDEDRDASKWSAPTRAPNPDRRARAAAASSGDGPGVADVPVTGRRDDETLHSQPLDAFEGYLLARHRTGDERTTVEEVRSMLDPGLTPEQSSRDGAGKGIHRAGSPATGSSRGRLAADARADGEAGAERPIARTPGERDGSRIGVDGDEPPGFRRPWIEKGPVATDAALVSARVSDDRDSSMVSAERRPGILELSRPGQLGPGREGRGDGVAPAWASRGRGDEPVPSGSQRAPFGETLEERTYRRHYNEYLANVLGRIAPLWEFPHDLALRLEQGEVRVTFTLRRDGTLKELRVVKPSGFQSFDRVIVAAIKRAAPFPPLPRELGSELQVTAPFEGANPLVR